MDDIGKIHLGILAAAIVVAIIGSVADALEESGAVGAAGVHREDGSFQPSPPPDTVLQPEDAVVVITKTDEGGGSFQKRATGKKILIADDHRALRLLFARNLASAGHEVIQAGRRLVGGHSAGYQ